VKTDKKVTKVEVSEGDRVRFDCPQQGARWTYVNDNLEEQELDLEHDEDNTLTLNEVAQNDEGVYSCHYFEPGIGYIKDSVNLLVGGVTGKFV